MQRNKAQLFEEKINSIKIKADTVIATIENYPTEHKRIHDDKRTSDSQKALLSVEHLNRTITKVNENSIDMSDINGIKSSMSEAKAASDQQSDIPSAVANVELLLKAYQVMSQCEQALIFEVNFMFMVRDVFEQPSASLAQTASNQNSSTSAASSRATLFASNRPATHNEPKEEVRKNLSPK